MELSIQERLKDLRVERGLTLEQLAEKTHLSKSALGSYEGDNLKDISHYALIELAKFYEVTVDYLLGRSQTRNHPNADLADLHLSDDMIELLKSGLVDNSLLCELATHPDFPRLMADLEIYVNGVAGKQVQSANAIVDAVSATIMKQHNPGLTDPQLRQLIAAHIDDDSFCRYVIQQHIILIHHPGQTDRRKMNQFINQKKCTDHHKGNGSREISIFTIICFGSSHCYFPPNLLIWIFSHWRCSSLKGLRSIPLWPTAMTEST